MSSYKDMQQLFEQLKSSFNMMHMADGNYSKFASFGISQDKITVLVFTLSGIFVGIAAPFYVSRVGTIQANMGTGIEMKLIAAAVIGGTAFSGGVISLFGTFSGVVLLYIIDNMLVMMRVPTYWQSMTTGVILLTAVVFSAFQSFSNDRNTKGASNNAEKTRA